jgi:hypothetical protein
VLALSHTAAPNTLCLVIMPKFVGKHRIIRNFFERTAPDGVCFIDKAEEVQDYSPGRS